MFVCCPLREGGYDVYCSPLTLVLCSWVTFSNVFTLCCFFPIAVPYNRDQWVSHLRSVTGVYTLTDVNDSTYRYAAM
jgi:hypothetical protein